jgi:hypothetical protein
VHGLQQMQPLWCISILIMLCPTCAAWCYKMLCAGLQDRNSCDCKGSVLVAYNSFASARVPRSKLCTQHCVEAMCVQSSTVCRCSSCRETLVCGLFGGLAVGKSSLIKVRAKAAGARACVVVMASLRVGSCAKQLQCFAQIVGIYVCGQRATEYLSMLRHHCNMITTCVSVCTCRRLQAGTITNRCMAC